MTTEQQYIDAIKVLQEVAQEYGDMRVPCGIISDIIRDKIWRVAEEELKQKP